MRGLVRAAGESRKNAVVRGAIKPAVHLQSPVWLRVIDVTFAVRGLGKKISASSR